MNCMLISTACLLVCVCAQNAGGDERDKLLAEPRQFLSNYRSLISHCTVGESAPQPSNRKKKELLLSSVANELAPAPELFFPLLPVCKGVSALTNR